MNGVDVRTLSAADTGDITADDVNQLLYVIGGLRSVLFTRALTLDQLIYQLSLPLAAVARQSPCPARSTGLISDFFLLPLRDFLAKYLSVLAELTPEQKQCLFQTKSRLSCALHFNYDLTAVELADERRRPAGAFGTR